MANHEKKISFGFSKVIKKPELNLQSVKCDGKKIDYIKCVDDNFIKVIGEDEKKDKELLIIPMVGSKSWHDRIINKINANIHKDIESKNSKALAKKNTSVFQQNTNNSSLDEQAAQEIINDLKSENCQPENENLVIEKASELPFEIQESTLENYEEIPIEKFGIAMLRGMGWKPDKGIGKNAQVIKSSIPTLRPKGIGLGADKIFQHNSEISTRKNTELKLEKGCYVKIIAGNLQNNYGIIESFDDDTGRIIVKLAVGNKIVSLNEVLVQPITKELYEKNSRVMNALTYEKYKNEMIHTNVKDKRRLLNELDEEIEHNVKNNTRSVIIKEHKTALSSSDNESNGEKSRKRVRSKKKKEYCDSLRFYERKEKKRHKKDKKRYKDDKYP